MAYTDIIQVFLLITGGIAVTFIGLQKIGIGLPDYSNNIFGGLKALYNNAPDKCRMVQSYNHPELPWLEEFFVELWLANIFYWGCNQFITQRTLAATNFWHGQMDVVFAGYLKLLIPVIVFFRVIMYYK